jgi:NAD(P)-dependent dehydrogenase (short-subunit alcohol dehydrogenase family)
VNIASQLGVVGRPAAPVYCASKAAVIAMTKCDAIDVSESYGNGEGGWMGNGGIGR